MLYCREAECRQAQTVCRAFPVEATTPAFVNAGLRMCGVVDGVVLCIITKSGLISDLDPSLIGFGCQLTSVSTQSISKGCTEVIHN